MRSAELADIPELARLDRFLQWDLATVNPWGVPVLAATGARLLPASGEIWTSTTVGFQAKVRNIRRHPKVALLRYEPEHRPVLVRGEAEVLEGDGTTNLTTLFELMSGPEGARPLFYDSASDLRWRGLYRQYWRRILIRVRVVEVGVFGPDGLELRRVSSWGPGSGASRRGPASHRDFQPGALDRRGRQMLLDGVPSVLAVPSGGQGAPLVYPAQVRQDRAGRILVRDQPGLPAGAVPRTSLAVRVLDDTYELARQVGWIGRLEPGTGWRVLVPRSTYGFTKPPGWIPDLAAGVAARAAAGREIRSGRVSTPEVGSAARRAGLTRAAPLTLSARAWAALEELFSATNAIAPWYSAWAVLAPDPALRAQLTYLANRFELERDWTQALLIRGERRVPGHRLAGAAVRLHPRSLDLNSESRRHDRLLERSRRVLRRELPDDLRVAVVKPLRGPVAGQRGLPLDRAAREAVRSAAFSGAAALDRLMRRG